MRGNAKPKPPQKNPLPKTLPTRICACFERTAGLVPEDLHVDVPAKGAELGVEVGEVFVGAPCVDHLVDVVAALCNHRVVDRAA